MTVVDVREFTKCIVDMTEFTCLLLHRTAMVPCQTEISFFGEVYMCSALWHVVFQV